MLINNTSAPGNSDLEKAVLLKNFSNWWRTLQMVLINFEINFKILWLSNCVIANWTGAATNLITDTKRYVPGLSLSTQEIRNCCNNHMRIK